jgi:putative transposase
MYQELVIIIKFLNHKQSKRDIENQVLSEDIKRVFEEHKARYGSLRIINVLAQQGQNVNCKQISRLMRLMGLCPKGSSQHIRTFKFIKLSIQVQYQVSDKGS